MKKKSARDKKIHTKKKYVRAALTKHGSLKDISPVAFQVTCAVIVDAVMVIY